MALYRWLEYIGEHRYNCPVVYAVTERLKMLVMVVWIARLK